MIVKIVEAFPEFQIRAFFPDPLGNGLENPAETRGVSLDSVPEFVH
jgi:hypothetical protein